MNNSIILIKQQSLDFGGFHLKPTGLVVRGKPSCEQWEQCGSVLQRMEGAVQWWIGDWLNYGEKAYGEKYAEAISEAQVKTWQQYAWVASSVETSIRIESLSWSHHQLVASLSSEEQRRLLAQAMDEGLTVGALRELIRADRISAAVWPDGKYGLILADPPWKPDAGLLDPTRQIENQYPTLTLQELVALRPRIDALACDHCILVMWTTSQKLNEATALIEGWGFAVKSGAVWIKDSIGMGYWFRGRHELLVLATRGNPATPLESDRPDSVIAAARRGHSEKPDEVYAVIERMFPHVPKVEIFARAERTGWAHGTNELALRSA